ncbi:MAG: hypothetical protein JW844_03255 [Candidatus Omnitrophica bacterium]|nr:hypothetical protein [Candidatus Omnitrophota bacterium]
MLGVLQFLFWIGIIWLLSDMYNAVTSGKNMHLPGPVRRAKQKLEEAVCAFIDNDGRKTGTG